MNMGAHWNLHDVYGQHKRPYEGSIKRIIERFQPSGFQWKFKEEKDRVVTVNQT